MARLIPLSCFVYERLLLLYPRHLRERFGGNMVEIFEDMLHDLPSHRRVTAFLLLWRTALLEFATIGFVARLQNTLLIAAAASVLLSSLLMWIFFRVVRA